MRNFILTFSLAIVGSQALAVNRGMISDYAYSLNLNQVRQYSGRVLLSEYGLNLQQEVRDFNDVKSPPYFKFQKLVTDYNRRIYCTPRTFEVSVFENKTFYYLPTLRTEILAIMRSKGNIYQHTKSANQGAMFWTNPSGKEVMGLISKTTPTEYVLSICTLKSG